MKLLLLLLELSSLFFFFFAIAANATDDIVLDTDGNSLQSHKQYYILPAIDHGQGGGLVLDKRNTTSPCPHLYVGQKNSGTESGQPLVFFPVDKKAKTITISTDVNVFFDVDKVNYCKESTNVWKLDNIDEITGRRYIATNGIIGRPGLTTVSNWFRIERLENNYYKFVFCPGVCSVCKVLCGDVGVFVEGGKSWLGFDGEPFPVMFKKV